MFDRMVRVWLSHRSLLGAREAVQALANLQLQLFITLAAPG
jgi:hypothetical protein